MTEEQLSHQLNRIESQIDKVVARVDTLEKRASFWGAVGGFLAMIATRFGGCL